MIDCTLTGLLRLGGVVQHDPVVPHLSRHNQVIQQSEQFVVVYHVRIWVMEQEQVDVVGVKPTEALLTRVLDETRSPPPRFPSLARVDDRSVEIVPGLGRDHDVVPPPIQRPRQHALSVSLSVRVCRIEVREPHVVRPREQVNGVLLGDMAVVVGRKRTQGHSYLGDCKLSVAYLAILHLVDLTIYGRQPLEQRTCTTVIPATVGIQRGRDFQFRKLSGCGRN